MSRCANCNHDRETSVQADGTVVEKPWNETVGSVDGNVEWLCDGCDRFLRDKARALRFTLIARGAVVPIRRPLEPDESLPDYWVQKPTFRIDAA
jgi:hypothetical protein